MKYYITYSPDEEKNENDYRIIKVQEVDETKFLEDYGNKIIASGNNLMEALLHFEKAKMSY
jgi:hypothetical protein